MKHTPGPWEAKQWDSAPEIAITSNDGTWIADVVAGEIGDYSTQEANARLIAAAPQLLEACEHAADVMLWLHREMGPHNCTTDCPDITKHVNELLAAIAAATEHHAETT